MRFLLYFCCTISVTLSCSPPKNKSILTAELPKGHTIFEEVSHNCSSRYPHCRKSYFTRQQQRESLPIGRLLVFSWHTSDYPTYDHSAEQTHWLSEKLLPQLKKSLALTNSKVTVKDNLLEIENLVLQDQTWLIHYYVFSYEDAWLHYIFLWQTDNYSKVKALEEQTLTELKPKFVAEVKNEENFPAEL